MSPPEVSSFPGAATLSRLELFDETSDTAPDAFGTPRERWEAACEAVALFAVDPSLGLRLRGRAGDARERLITYLASLLPADCQIRRMPAGCRPSALTGGLDLAATLATGRSVVERGLLERADRGVLVAVMAERMPRDAGGILAAALDTGTVRIERDGLSLVRPACFGLVALDEGLDSDEAPARAICERLAIVVNLDGADPRGADRDTAPRYDVEEARARLAHVQTDMRSVELLCRAAEALGIPSLRAPSHAVKAARAAAALTGTVEIDDAAIETAIRHVLGPRATQVPRTPDAPSQPETDAQSTTPDDDMRDDRAAGDDEKAGGMPDDVTVEARTAVLPPSLLATLASLARPPGPRGTHGRAGTSGRAESRGRIIGIREGDPRRERLDLIATLGAAAPWQPLRRREAGVSSQNGGGVRVRSSDFRVRRYKAKRETATIFCVDASGSAALARLAEAKGAVETILAECYVRRDRVALVAFRGTQADILLPETRSLTRAKRALAAFPAGGGTPLAGGIAAAHALARASLRDGRTPLICLLTDGRANIAADGVAGRPAAMRDARAAAEAVRSCGLTSLVIDTGQRPGPAAREIADAMGARYLAMPRINSAALADAVSRSAGPCPSPGR